MLGALLETLLGLQVLRGEVDRLYAAQDLGLARATLFILYVGGLVVRSPSRHQLEHVAHCLHAVPGAPKMSPFALGLWKAAAPTNGGRGRNGHQQQGKKPSKGK